MDNISNGIKASDDIARSIIVLKYNNYRVWSVILEQALRERKLWGHVMATAVRPLEARAVVATVTGAPAAAGHLAGIAVPGVTQEEHDTSAKKIEDFEAACAHANYIILTSIEQKDVMALALLTSPSEK